MATSVTQISNPNIFQQLGDPIGMMYAVKDFVASPTGFNVRLYDEIAADPTALADSCVKFAKEVPQPHLGAIVAAHMMATIMQAGGPTFLPADLNEKLIAVLRKISPETVEKATAAFNKLEEHLRAGGSDLDAFHQLNPRGSLEEKRTYILEVLTDTCDPLAEKYKLQFDPSSPSGVVQNYLFAKLREIRKTILASPKLNPATAKVAKELLNTSLIPGVLSSVTMMVNAPTGSSPSDIDPVVDLIRTRLKNEVDEALVFLEPVQKKFMEELESLSSPDPTIGESPKDLVYRVVRALRKSLQSETSAKEEVSQANPTALLLNCCLVKTILQSNLIEFAEAAKRQEELPFVLQSTSVKGKGAGQQAYINENTMDFLT